MTGRPDDQEEVIAFNQEKGLYCTQCGYRLDKHEGHACPECGQPYDIDDAKSVEYSPSGGPRRGAIVASTWVMRGYLIFLGLMVALAVLGLLLSAIAWLLS